MASGRWTYVGAAAAERDIPFGTRLLVAGIGYLTVEDRGQSGLFAVDVFVPSCRAAYQVGRSVRRVTILQ